MKILHAIFDLDGTITQSNEVWVDAVFKYIDNHCPYKREDLPEGFFSKIIFTGTYNALDYLRNTMGDTTDYKKIIEIIMENVDRGYSEPRPLKKGVFEFIKSLKETGADVCIISATPTYYVKKALELCGVLPYVDFIISGEERKSGKEAPYVFLEAAARMNCDVSECVLFEDALYSIKTGKNLGMRVVGIQDFYSTPEAIQKLKQICDIYTDDYSVIKLD